MRKRILLILRRIRRLERRRAGTLRRLLLDAPLLRASLSLVKRTCGKPSCHCATQPGHDVWVLTTSQGGRRRCQVVRQDDVDTVRQLLSTYQEYREGLRALDATHTEEKLLLRGLMEKRNVPYE
jgi:hypothetical protein